MIGNPRAELAGRALADQLVEETTCKHSWVPASGLIQDGIEMVCEKCGEPKENDNG